MIEGGGSAASDRVRAESAPVPLVGRPRFSSVPSGGLINFVICPFNNCTREQMIFARFRTSDVGRGMRTTHARN